MYNKFLMSFEPTFYQFDKQTAKVIELYTLPCFHLGTSHLTNHELWKNIFNTKSSSLSKQDEFSENC